MRVTLIHNPQAGGEDHSRERLLTLIRAAGYEAVYCSSKEDFDAALKDPGDLVAVAGGDGTVRKVAMHTIQTGVPMAILPMGTANNISKSLGIVGSPEELIQGWSAARRKRHTVGQATSSWGEELFIEGMGMGLFTRAMTLLDYIDDKAPDSFSSAYDKLYRDLSALIVLVSEFSPITLKVTVDGEDVSGPYLLMEAMNMNFVGPNLHLAPEADPGDGHLDFVFLAEDNRENFARYLTKRLAGKEAEPPVRVIRGSSLQFYWRGTAIHLDDKIWTNGITVPSSAQVIDVKVGDKFIEFLV
ncbi:MAG TPA: diacylglycerol kinase family protein [Blastocatellia bacterium]|nr:diacylglycerol kinase family protein [Blastocatellia bacterium]